MSEKASNPPPVVQFSEQLPAQVGGVSAIASANAPFIYFDGTPNFGINNGVINISLEALRFQPGTEAVIVDRVIVAHLRMSVLAAVGLRDSLTKAIEMTAPAKSSSEVN